ncbi:unnamed protein product [Mytilus edulis]|uniref:Uncharacterized protein n=1 Tax=Mytilus edulis TaxID=6550 RepID=A0A8S3QL01_MYTED|nr:unnamed protein product [Mytilus edulis]
MMNTVRDNLIINDELVPITGGSFGEGLDLRGGDIDIIHAHRLIDVSEHRKFPFDDRRTYLKMETETIQAGYTMLHCISTHNNNALQCCTKINGKDYFSNVSYKERLLLDQTMPMVIHGPCLSNEQADFDIAQALHRTSGGALLNNIVTGEHQEELGLLNNIATREHQEELGLLNNIEELGLLNDNVTGNIRRLGLLNDIVTGEHQEELGLLNDNVTGTSGGAWTPESCSSREHQEELGL